MRVSRLPAPESNLPTCNKSVGRRGVALRSIVPLVAVMLVGTPAWSAVLRIQQASGAGVGVLSVGWSGATTAGNLLVASVSCLGGSGTTITPPAGWTSVLRVDNATTITAGIYMMSNAASQSGASSWTCSGLRSGTLSLAEYSGVAASSVTDVTASGTGSGTAPASGTVLTTQPGELAIAVIANNTASTASSYSGSFIAENQPADPLGSITTATADGLLATAGPLTAAATLSGSATWAMALATFKAVGPPTRYWIGATSGYFDDNTRWSSTSGGANDATAPNGPAQTSVFDGNGSGDCVLRGDPNLAGIQMLSTPTAGYSGAVRGTEGATGSLVGAGLTGDWYTGTSFGALMSTVLDATVNYPDMLATATARTGVSTNFSVRYRGQVLANYSETYTFYTQSDDGVRLYVNEQLVIDNWTPHSSTENSGTISLTAGQWYDVRLEYFQGGGFSVLELEYQSPSEAKKIIPATNLRSTGNTAYYQGLSSDWYSGIAFNTYMSNARDTTVDFPDTTGVGMTRTGAATTYSARWSGQVLATYAETYTFYTRSDDGVRLYVNGSLIVDHWNDHTLFEDSGTISLSAGQWYNITLEYYNDSGAGAMQLSFQSASESKKIIPLTSLRTSAVTYVGGLSGDWYAGVAFDSYLPNFSDSTVNYSDVTATALARINRSEYYSVRWTGQVLANFSETYTFYTQSDDGVRLYVNNTLVVNNWTNHGTLENSGTIALTAGQWYDVTLEYYQSNAASVIQLKYQSPSVAKQIIPATNLRMGATDATTLTLGAAGLDQRAGTFVGGSRNIAMSGSFALSGGLFQTTSNLMSIGGLFTKTGGTFSGGVGRVVMTSPSSQAFTSGGAILHDLYFNDGLVGYWKLDETGGNSAADSSGYGSTGQIASFPGFPTTGLPPLGFTDAASLSFSGAGQGLTVPHTALLSFTAAQSYTLSAWVNATNLTLASAQAVVVKARNTTNYYGIYMSAAPTPKWVAGANGANVTGSVVAAGWHHLAVVQDGPGNRRDIYVDGVSTGNGAAADGSGVGDLWIGRSSAGETFTGGVDDVRVYNRALSTSELRALSLGNQPSTGVATQTLAGTLNVSGTLALMSGIVTGSSAIAVGGSWMNSGATYTNTGNVTFNGGAIGFFIQSGGQAFPAVTISGAGGGWTLADRLWVPGGAVTLTAGTLNGGVWTARVGTLTSSGATFTPATGTVILDSRSNQTIPINSFGGLRLESTTETGLVAYWKLDLGTGMRFPDHSGSGNAGTLSPGSLWTTSVPTLAYDDPAAMSLNGTTAFGSMGATNLPAANAAQSITAWAKFSSSTANQAIVALTRVGASSGLELGLGGGNVRVFQYGGANVVTNAAPTDGLWHHLAYTYDGVTERLYIDGGAPATATGVTHQTSTPDASWIGTSNGGADFFSGQVDDVRVYNASLSAAQVASLAVGRYAGTGGLATMTLGTNLAVSGTFAIDNDNLVTGTRTLTASSATAPAVLSNGTYTVGSAPQIFAGGFSVQPQGTVTMGSSGGTLTIGATKMLTVLGTLNASGIVGSPFPRVDCSGCLAGQGITAAFGSTSNLNVNGLEVDNSVATGVSIASGATYTLFKRLKLQNNVGGATSTHLVMTLGTAVVNIPGCYFDATAAHNVTLYGTMGAPAGARAIFENQSSVVNGTGAGKSLDQDGDTNGDNFGDNTSTGPYYGSVVEWVGASPTDTSGTAVGYPTPAFDWNTFAFYGIYVAYKDATGAGTPDLVWVRNNDGSPAYSYSVPQSSGDIVGTPLWDTVNETTAAVDANGNGNKTDTDVHVVYIATTLGHIIKLVDSGASLARPAAGPWSMDFTSASVATISSPLIEDGVNLYFGGTDGSAAPKIFGVQVAGGVNEKTLQKNIGAASAIAAVPSWAVYGGSTYVFLGSTATSGQAYIYRVNMTAGSVNASFSGVTSTINGSVRLLTNRAYAVTDGGTMHVLDAANLNSGGFVNLPGFPYQTAAASPIKAAPYVDSRTNYAYLGDVGGNLYVVTDTGGNLAGYPFSISGSIQLSSSPLYLEGSGVIAIGANDGYIYFIDRHNSSNVPTIFKRYFLTSAGTVSSVAYDYNTSEYMVSSSDGKLEFIKGADVTDPTSGVE
jgi:hypothetical protein